MKRRITAFLVLFTVLMSIFSFSSIAYADADIESADIEDSAEIGTRAEATTWYYRINNGIRERRLWSVTYLQWLTDWQPY